MELTAERVLQIGSAQQLVSRLRAEILVKDVFGHINGMSPCREACRKRCAACSMMDCSLPHFLPISFIEPDKPSLKKIRLLQSRMAPEGANFLKEGSVSPTATRSSSRRSGAAKRGNSKPL